LQWAISLRDEPAEAVPPDIRHDLARHLPDAIAEAEAKLVRVDADEVGTFLKAFAERRGLPIPTDPIALEMDIECLSEMPRGAFRAAAKWLWKHWTYRRLPDVGDFTKAAGAGLGDMQADLSALRELDLKLSTLALREGAWEDQTRRMREASRRIQREQEATMLRRHTCVTKTEGTDDRQRNA
jgi:hypothetical protein